MGFLYRKFSLEYTSQISIAPVTHSVQNMSPDEYASALKTAGGKPGDARTNWLDQISRTGASAVNRIVLSGTLFIKNHLTYRLSINYQKTNGNLLNDGFTQGNVRLNLNQSLLEDRLKLNLILNSEYRDGQNGQVEAFRYAAIYNPTVAPTGGANSNQYGGYTELGGFDNYNPLSIVNQSTDDFTNKNLQAALGASFDIGEGFKLNGLVSRRRNTYFNGQYYNKTALFRGAATDGRAIVSNTASQETYFSSYLEYKKYFGNINLSAASGYDMTDYSLNSSSIAAGHTISDASGYNGISQSTDIKKGLAAVNSNAYTSRLAAFFARANVTFDNTYAFSAVIRREGYSGFADGSKWGNYGSVGANINLGNLGEIKYILGQLNLRAAYSITGGLTPEPYLSQSSFVGDGAGGFSITRNPSLNLKNESKRELNIGVDWIANASRFISGSIDFYKRDLTDLIYNFNNLPIGSYEANNLWLNAGSLTNSGVEARLSVDLLRSKDLGWRSTLLLGSNFVIFNAIKSDVLQAGNNGNLVIGNCACGAYQPSTILSPQNLIGQIWTYKYAGVDNSGIPLVYNADGTPIPIYSASDKDKKIVANGLPKLTLGWSNDVHYKAFSLTANFVGAFGHSLINSYRANYENNNVGSIALYNRVKTKYWDAALKEGTTTSNQVEDASYLRLNYLQFAYDFNLGYPQKFVKKLRVYLASSNVFTITGYSGIDPSVSYGYTPQSSSGSDTRNIKPNPLFSGDDNLNTYVLSRSISLGVNVGF